METGSGIAKKGGCTRYSFYFSCLEAPFLAFVCLTFSWKVAVFYMPCSKAAWGRQGKRRSFTTCSGVALGFLPEG